LAATRRGCVGDEGSTAAKGGERVKKHQYRCNRCLIIEDRVLREELTPLCSVPCSRCGGLAIKLPAGEAVAALFAGPVGAACDMAECEYAYRS
jgi:hypothetical protein